MRASQLIIISNRKTPNTAKKQTQALNHHPATQEKDKEQTKKNENNEIKTLIVKKHKNTTSN